MLERSHKEMREHMSKRLSSGVPVEKLFFEQGFRACIESVRDKGHHELVKLLEMEHSRIEELKDLKP